MIMYPWYVAFFCILYNHVISTAARRVCNGVHIYYSYLSQYAFVKDRVIYYARIPSKHKTSMQCWGKVCPALTQNWVIAPCLLGCQEWSTIHNNQYTIDTIV